MIVARIGKVYGPYSGRCFASRSETDIEHLVARSEAHDSGLCAAELGAELLDVRAHLPAVPGAAPSPHRALQPVVAQHASRARSTSPCAIAIADPACEAK